MLEGLIPRGVSLLSPSSYYLFLDRSELNRTTPGEERSSLLTWYPGSRVNALVVNALTCLLNFSALRVFCLHYILILMASVSSSCLPYIFRSFVCFSSPF